MTTEDESEFRTAIAGPLIQMTALMIHEKRSHLAEMNSIGELCAQFRSGLPAMIRALGKDKAVALVEAYHQQHPEAAKSPWHADALDHIAETEWQQLYVNAEHDGRVGVITISRESYNRDVNAELNRAIDWLTAAKIQRVILSSDFHLSTQMVGADTNEFFPALEDVAAGEALAAKWTATARRLHTDFETSVGVITGKRCLGGMLELMSHCHFVVAATGTQLGFPEVTLPVVPGMEACHWTFRKARAADWPKLMALLLSGKSVRAEDAVGWLIDASGSINDVLATAWSMAAGTSPVARRAFADGALAGLPETVQGLPATDGPSGEAARKAIHNCITASCGASAADALAIQAKHSAEFMVSTYCRKGRVGTEFTKTMAV
jgi:enoyl-CoA hydratase/carnithine racemase